MKKNRRRLFSDKDGTKFSEDFEALSEQIKAFITHLPLEPQNIVVNGKVDVLQHSKSKVTINTEQGTINGILKDASLNAEIKQYWGTEATVYGIGHYKPNGRLNYIEIERIYQSTPEDKYFSKIPFAESTDQQILKQTTSKSNKNWMREIAGKWPNDVSDEEFDNLLNNL